MIPVVVVFLAVVWFLGYINLPNFPFLNLVLFSVSGISVTVYQMIVLVVMIYLIDLLPGVFRYLAGILLILWLLSMFGIISIVNFPHIVVLALIFGLVYYLIAGKP